MRIYVAGHRGMVGGAISRKLGERGVEVITRTHAELDLTDQTAVRTFSGQVSFDASKPDGTMRKLMDSSRLNKMGSKAKIMLVDGIRQTHQWFLDNHD